MYIAVARKYILNAARKSDKMLEPYDGKLSRTVLREERGSNAPDLLDYSPLIAKLGGETVRISASSENYINAMEMDKDYGDGENPIALKSEFVMSLCEQLMGAGKIEARDKSIIDRCTDNVYKDYLSGKTDTPPTLVDFRNDLLNQPEQAAHDMALALELFTEGSLNVFAHQSNVDTSGRIIAYDILDLGEQLKPIGLLIMLDNILNRVIANRKKGRYTRINV